MTELSDRDRMLLQFEERWPRHTGTKESAILNELDMRVPRYYQLLGRIIEDPAALAAEPMLVHRLLRARAAKSWARAHLVASAPRLPHEPGRRSA